MARKARVNLNIRLTPEQKERIAELAKTYGKSTTEFVLLSMEYIGETRPTFQVKPQAEVKQGKKK